MHGEKGELVASGPNIFMGYWKDKTATKKALDDLGYHTGDTGYQDEEGFFYVQAEKTISSKSAVTGSIPRKWRMPYWLPGWSSKRPYWACRTICWETN